MTLHRRYNCNLKLQMGSAGFDSVVDERIDQVFDSLRHNNPSVLGSLESGIKEYGIHVFSHNARGKGI